jgi:hypothetical protein
LGGGGKWGTSSTLKCKALHEPPKILGMYQKYKIYSKANLENKETVGIFISPVMNQFLAIIIIFIQ